MAHHLYGVSYLLSKSMKLYKNNICYNTNKLLLYNYFYRIIAPVIAFLHQENDLFHIFLERCLIFITA